MLPQQIASSDDVIQRCVTELSKNLANVIGKCCEIIDKHLRCALEILPQRFVLCCYSHWAGIKMALTSHAAAERDECGSAEIKFLCAQHGCNHNITRRFQAAVDAYRDPFAQAVQDEHLLRFRQSQFPGTAGIGDPYGSRAQ